MSEGLTESALLLAIPEAEASVATYRQHFDPAAAAGVPAHITVSYPFKPLALVTPSDEELLRRTFAARPAFLVELTGVSWFGQEVIFLEPAGPEPIIELTCAVERAFPEYPPYGGAFTDIHPHLTVGDHADLADLQQLEPSLIRSLPIQHYATAVELWAGPALASRTPGWRMVRTFPLGL